MPPVKPAMSLLFHPKKKPQQQQTPQHQQPRQAMAQTGSPSPAQRPQPAQKQAVQDDGLQLPDGPFQEFRLLSSALNGWKYDVMKFDSRKPVDLYQWEKPVRLNRKDLRKDEAATNMAPEAVGPMLGPDGKPVIGADGREVKVDAEGKPIHSWTGGSVGQTRDKGKGPNNAKKRFQKKTRQVFYVPDEIRQLRREERYPWVMEDSSATQNEVWVGQMEETSKSETHAFFMPAANDIFKFVPAHRWYKFQKRLKHAPPTDTANVENLFKQAQKRDPTAWLALRGKTASAATLAALKGTPENQASTQSLGPGGRKLKTVDSGADTLFGDDDEEGGRGRNRRLGEEGDIDEQVYEEEFADDEEPMELDADDEEAKEAEERLKKELRAANKLRDAGVDDSEEEDEAKPDKNAKAMQKLIKKREGVTYESDEEEDNPYASSAEEEEEEEPIVATAASAIQEQQAKIESRAQTPKPNVPRPSVAPVAGISPSHSPSLGGHSVVAKRATSPKIPKPKANISRGNSPLGGQTQLGGSRATSPVHELPNGSSLKTNLKRKADDSAPGTPIGHTPNGSTAVNKKRKTPAVAPVIVTSEELEAMLVEWVRTATNASTRDCIQHFTPYLTDAAKKTEFSAMVKRHASLKNGVLVFRSTPRSGSAAPSPPATT